MSDFLSFLAEHWREILVLTREHMMIVPAATGLAVLIGLPLGILLTRIKSLQTPILGVANVLQTVPSLALFGLLIPLPFIGGIGATLKLSPEAVHEFQLATTGFDVSTSLTTNGAVNIVTRAGGNDSGGGLLLLYRGNRLSAYPAVRREPLKIGRAHV